MKLSGAEIFSSSIRLLPVYLIPLLWGTASSVSVNGPVMPLNVRPLGMDVVG